MYFVIEKKFAVLALELKSERSSVNCVRSCALDFVGATAFIHILGVPFWGNNCDSHLYHMQKKNKSVR